MPLPPRSAPGAPRPALRSGGGLQPTSPIAAREKPVGRPARAERVLESAPGVTTREHVAELADRGLAERGLAGARGAADADLGQRHGIDGRDLAHVEIG